MFKIVQISDQDYHLDIKHSVCLNIQFIKVTWNGKLHYCFDVLMNFLDSMKNIHLIDVEVLLCTDCGMVAMVIFPL